jgi:hypothetical protein
MSATVFAEIRFWLLVGAQEQFEREHPPGR